MKISCFIYLALVAISHQIQALQSSNALLNEEDFVLNSIEDDVDDQHQDTNETSLILDPSELEGKRQASVLFGPQKSKHKYAK